nr:MAG TPA: hypothetical protein [Caudoviricetes sp.]
MARLSARDTRFLSSVSLLSRSVSPLSRCWRSGEEGEDKTDRRLSRAHARRIFQCVTITARYYTCRSPASVTGKPALQGGGLAPSLHLPGQKSPISPPCPTGHQHTAAAASPQEPISTSVR